MGAFKLRPSLLPAKIDDRWMLLDIDSGNYLEANETATMILEEIEAGSSVEKVVEALVARFEVDPATAKDDVNAFIEKMQTSGRLISV